MVKFLLIITLQTLCIYAEPSKSPQIQSNKWMKDQNDQTDTLAIPLDNSEEEEKQEEELLNKSRKKSSK